MIEIDIKPIWMFKAGSDASPEFDLQLLNLLRGIHDTGKLTQAARQVGMSYRHAWNMIGKWSQFFGSPLVHMQKGRGATLSALGEKLLWAEERIHARLTPQFRNLTSELAVEINRVLNDSKQVLRVRASHGYAIAQLCELLARNQEMQLDLQYQGSRDALESLCRGDCELAGFHVPDGELGLRAIRRFYDRVEFRTLKIIHFVTRRQGLILARGNPHGIQAIADLASGGWRFVNRQHGSGTRMLFDLLLEQEGFLPDSVLGYAREEFTHDAVAAFVASGMADVGFGIEAAARHFNLDFVPLATEHYFLTCRHDMLAHPRIASVLALLGQPEFRESVDTIPGYAADLSGELSNISELFPDF